MATKKQMMAVGAAMAVALVVPGWARAEEPGPAKTAGVAAARAGGDEAPASPAPVVDGDYRIGPEDTLDIAVWNNTAISRTVPVRPDGKISLPLLNDVQAAGLTPMQLREVLVKRLADYMPTPEVSVIVREVHSFKVSVMGEVKKAGQYELKSRATVLDVIALAGGFTEFAARSRIVILRPNGGAVKRVAFNYNKAVGSEVPPDELFLQPGDVVVVP
jgi:polysaccharide biosynthesis/export protein